jgi:hypothetical protein
MSVANMKDRTERQLDSRKTPRPRLVEELRQHLHPYNQLRVRRRRRGHHERNEHVLLFIERARIQRHLPLPQTETLIRHPTLPGFAQRVRQQLGHIGADRDGRLPDAEQLVDEGEEDSEGDADGPRANGGAGEGGVVFVVDDGADFGVAENMSVSVCRVMRD